MMNVFKTGPAFLQLQGQLKKFNKNGPAIEAAHAAGEYERERSIILENAQVFARELSEKWHLQYEIVGYENLPESGPVLIMANHQSFADVLAMFYALDKFQVGYIAKAEFTKWKALATAIGFTRSLFIYRGDARETVKTLRQATELLRNGFSMAIYPEGTRSRGGEMSEFKSGSFKFAEKARVPILPVTVDGGWHLFEEKFSFQRCRIRVTIHPLVDYGNMTRDEQKQAQQEIYETIKGALLPGGPDQSGL